MTGGKGKMGQQKLGCVPSMSDVNGLTKQQACDQLAKYPHDPLLIGDLRTQAFIDNCWCRDSIAVHEEAHKSQWVSCIQPKVDSFAAWCASHEIDIVCSQPASTDCATALTAAIKVDYDSEWDRLIGLAYQSWDAIPDIEADALSAECDCYQEIIDALKDKCNS